MAGYEDPYPGRKGSDRVVRACWKCDGTGRVPFEMVDRGRCWACGGAGQISVLVSSVRAGERRRVSREQEKVAEDRARAERVRRGFAAAVERMRPVLGDWVDVVEEEPGAEYPQCEKALRRGAYETLLEVRDGLDVETALSVVRARREGGVNGVNRRAGFCVACGGKVARGAGVNLEVATEQGWLTLCQEHAPIAAD